MRHSLKSLAATAMLGALVAVAGCEEADDAYQMDTDTEIRDETTVEDPTLDPQPADTTFEPGATETQPADDFGAPADTGLDQPADTGLDQPADTGLDQPDASAPPQDDPLSPGAAPEGDQFDADADADFDADAGADADAETDVQPIEELQDDEEN